MTIFGVGDLRDRLESLKLSSVQNDQEFHPRQRSYSGSASGRSLTRRRENPFHGTPRNHRQSPPRQTQDRLQGFVNFIRENYHPSCYENVREYIERSELLTIVRSKCDFMDRCSRNGYIPRQYWMDNAEIKCTKEICKLLDKCSLQLFRRDQQVYYRQEKNSMEALRKRRRWLSEKIHHRDYTAFLDELDIHNSEILRNQRMRLQRSFESLEKEYKNPLEPQGRNEERNPRVEGQNRRVQRRRTQSSVSSVRDAY